MENIILIICIGALLLIFLYNIYETLATSYSSKKRASEIVTQLHGQEEVEIRIEVVAENEATTILQHIPYDEQLRDVRDDCRKLVNSFENATVNASHISQVDCLGKSNDDGEFDADARKATISLLTRTNPASFNYGDCIRSIETAVNDETRVDSLETVWIDGVDEPEEDVRDVLSDKISSDNYNRAKNKLQENNQINADNNNNEVELATN